MTDDLAVRRPMPHDISPLYKAYFEALAEGKVRVPKCRACGELQWPPSHMCAHCHSVEFDSAEMPGTATVYSFATVYRAFHPWFASRTPYHVVIGDFGNGVRIVGTMWEEDAAGELRCDAPVLPSFTSAGDLTVLEWRAAKV